MKITSPTTRFGQRHCCVCTAAACYHVGPIQLCDEHKALREKETLTTDRTDPALTHGIDTEPVPQAAKYLVLSDEERSRGFVRPVRRTYKHLVCGAHTTMNLAIAETYASDPRFYGATYCCACRKHLPVGADGEFVWVENGVETALKVGA